jgi:hypothetical protein
MRRFLARGWYLDDVYGALLVMPGKAAAAFTAFAFDQRVVEVPIHTRYHADASSTSMRANIAYGLSTLGVMARWRLHKAGILKSRLFVP